MTTDLPPGWTEITVAELCDVKYGKALRKKDRAENGPVCVYGSAGLVGHHNSALVDDPAVIVGRKGNAGSVWVAEKPSWPIDTTYFLRVSSSTSARFLGYQLESLELGVRDSSTTIPSLRRPDLEAVPVRLAPQSEQARIVAAIEEHFSRLDAFEASLRSSLNSGAALKLSILRTAFYLDQSLPERWEQKEIGEVADVHLGRQRSPQHHSGSQMRPYLRAANVTWDGINLDDVKEMNFDTSDFKTFRLHPGDLLLNEASGSPNEVGKPAVWRGEIEDCCFQNTLLRLQSRDIDPDYLYWYCYMAALTGRFGEAGRGVNIRHLGKQGLARFPIAVAPRAEQKEIVARLQEQFQQSSECETSVRQALERGHALRRSILTQGFSGQLVSQELGQ